MAAEKVSKLMKMLDDPDHQMRAIQKLGLLMEDGKIALPKLWKIVNDLNAPPPSDGLLPPVRAAALRAIVSMDGANPETVAGLIERLSTDPANEVVLQAAQSLGSFGPTIKKHLPRLFEILTAEQYIDIRAAIARSIIQINGNDDQLFERAIAVLRKPDDQIVVMTSILSELELTGAHARQALKALWDVMRQNPPFNIAEPVFLAIISITADDDAVLESLLGDNHLNIQTKAFAITDARLRNNVKMAFQASNDTRLLGALLGALKVEGRGSSDAFIFRDVLDLLAIGQFDNQSLGQVLEAVKICIDRTGQGLELLCRYDTSATRQWLMAHKDTSVPAVGVFLVRDAPDDIWTEQWTNEPASTAGHVVAMLTDLAYSNDRQLKDRGINDLQTNNEKISWEVCEEFLEQLKQKLDKAADKSQPRQIDEYYTGRALDVLQNRHKKMEEDRLLNVIRDDQKEYEERIQKIKLLIQADQADAIRGLVEIWTQWILENNKAELVEATAGVIRNSPTVILPLVDRLNKNYTQDAQLTQAEAENLGLIRYRRIARQLADMSDPRFFNDNLRHANIQDQLRKHAIPALSRRLRDETDLEARENLARALANLGGREAVDAVVRAVVDEEKKRTARQELLAEYYLQPSRKQSDEAANILSRAVEDARNTLKLLKTLNTIFFGVGVAVLLTGVLTSLFNAESGARIAGALAGFGGLIGVVAQLIFNPLDRIQKAMTNLVQLETAFMSFIWELNLNGTYIQSQYVAEGVLTDEEIAKTINRIESAMNLTMNLVSTHTEMANQNTDNHRNGIPNIVKDAITRDKS